MKTAKSVDVNWLSFSRIYNFIELLGQHFSCNILQKKRQNKKYSLPGLRGLGPVICYLNRTSCRGFEVTQVDEDRKISRCELAVVCPYIKFHSASRPTFQRQYSTKETPKQKKIRFLAQGDSALVMFRLIRTSCRGFEVTQVDKDRQICQCELAVSSM